MSAGGGPRSGRQELVLLLLLTLANGVVGLDRLTASFLSPYLLAELHLSNTQIGLLGAALSLAVAASAFLLGRLADVTGARKTILVVATVGFSLGSALGGLAGGFAMLLLARFVLGLAEGPMVPIAQAVMADASAPSRRGFNMGFMQMAGAFLIGAMIGPVLVTRIADAHGWRAAFFLSAVPGLVLALLLALVMRDPPRPAVAAAPVPLASVLGDLLRIPNMRWSLVIAATFSAWLMVQNVFLPIFLTSAKGLAPSTMGWVIGMGGLAGIVGGTALPALSDRIGRRPVVTGACLAALIAPVALILLPGAPLPLGLAILFGWLPIGVAPLYCAVIPSESVPPGLVTSAIGLSMATAELLGGVVAPFAAGRLADAFGLSSTLWLCLLFALVAAWAASRLAETAPRLSPSPRVT